MANWYTTRCEFQRATRSYCVGREDVIDRHIEAASRLVDQTTSRFFLPKKQSRTYRWPGRYGDGVVLWTDQDLISVNTLQTKAQDCCPTTVSACDFFLEPNNSGPPFNRIEIDLSSNSSFESGDTPQRSISVCGCWGYSGCTRCGGTIDNCGALTASATTVVVSDASKVNAGHTLLVDCERVFVADKTFAALGAITIPCALTADMSQVTVTVDACHGISAGETIRLDCEQMFVLAVRCNCLNVDRAFAGTVLAAHCACTAVNINRTLTIERGVNGTAAAAHCDGACISVYQPEFDVQNWTLAEAIAMYHQEGAGWGRTIGSGEGATEMRATGLTAMRKDMTKKYKRLRSAVV